MSRICAHCGQSFEWISTRPNGGGRPAKYCGPKCKSRANHSDERDRGYVQPKSHVGKCEMCGGETRGTHRKSVPKRCDACKAMPSSTPLPADHWALWYGKSSKWPNWRKKNPVLDVSRVFVYGTCRWCALAFMSEWHGQGGLLPRYCSSRCKLANRRSRRSIRERASFVADVNRGSIFVRDDWRCHICKRKVSKVKQVPHPRAATIDHLVPLAQGGTHEPANVATACFECNCIKSDGAANDQLMLVG